MGMFGFRLLLLSGLTVLRILSLCAAETVVVDKSFNKREVKVRVGGSIRVDLQELGAAGYVWKLQKVDEEYFLAPEVHSEEKPAQVDITGAPVRKSWLVRTKKAGLSELKFIHYRPWEGEQNPSDTFVIRVRIVP